MSAEPERRVLEGGELIQPGDTEPEVHNPAMAKALDELRRVRDDLVDTLEQQRQVAHREGPSFTVDRDHSWIEGLGFEVVRHSPPVGSIAVGAAGAGFGLIVPDEDTGRHGLAETYGPDLHLTSPQHPALHVEGQEPLPPASPRGLPSIEDIAGALTGPEGTSVAPEGFQIPEEAIPGEVAPGVLELDALPLHTGDHVLTRYNLQAWCETHRAWHPVGSR